MGHDAASKKRMLEIALGAVEELVHQHDVAGTILFLERTDGADTDDPGDSELLQGPEVGPVVQFARQNAVSAAVSREENDFAPGEFACEQLIRRWAERGFDLHPFLVSEAFQVVKPAAADDADAMFGHAVCLTTKCRKHT